MIKIDTPTKYEELADLPGDLLQVLRDLPQGFVIDIDPV
jgi:hypothetical protein